MNCIYVSFPSYIAKVLRQEYAKDGAPIIIPPHLKSELYWRKQYPSMSGYRLRQMPSIEEMFATAIRTGKEEESFTPYNLAYSMSEYNAFPDSDEKRDELVAFRLPEAVSYGNSALRTDSKTVMEKAAGDRFRRAMVVHFYEFFCTFIHVYFFKCAERRASPNISDGIRLFADRYDFSAVEQETLRRRYYRCKKQNNL